MAALTEEQTIIRDQAETWAREKAPVGRFRAMRDSGAALGFEEALWRETVDLGWTGMIVPEAYGGAGEGYLTFGLALEALGRELAASPLLASGLIGAAALLEVGDDSQKQALLPKLVDGSAIVTLAVDDGPRHAPSAIGLEAERTADGFRLRGAKKFVFEGLAATHVVLAASMDGAPTLLLAEAAALKRAPMRMIDSRGYARIELDGVVLGEDAILDGGGPGALDRILDRARAGVAAEMLGVAGKAFDMTLDYLKNRKQFGRVIGSFQALGHRAAALYTAQELARSCVEAALTAIDEDAPDTAAACSLAKAKVGDFLFEMSNQLIQIHGGIGMTDEFDAGLYLKRARVLETAFGGRAFHRDRYATLLGF